VYNFYGSFQIENYVSERELCKKWGIAGDIAISVENASSQPLIVVSATQEIYCLFTFPEDRLFSTYSAEMWLSF